MIPPLGNSINSLLKATSLASVISVEEIMRRSDMLMQEHFQILEVYAAATAVPDLTSVRDVAPRRSKRHFGRSTKHGNQARRLGRIGARIKRTKVRAGFGCEGRCCDRFEQPQFAHCQAICRWQPILVSVEEGTGEVPAVRMEAVYKYYGDFTALNEIDLKVASGEKIVICGPSGSGKSTLIRCINHIEKHDQGLIYVNGTELDDQRKNIDAIRRDTGTVLPELQPVPAHDDSGELHPGADDGKAARRGGGEGSRHHIS